jgi:hypothetical protein
MFTRSWWNVVEANGSSLAIPFEPREPLRVCPLRLVVWHRITEDEGTGQQYVDDAMLRALVQTEEE